MSKYSRKWIRFVQGAEHVALRRSSEVGLCSACRKECCGEILLLLHLHNWGRIEKRVKLFSTVHWGAIRGNMHNYNNKKFLFFFLRKLLLLLNHESHNILGHVAHRCNTPVIGNIQREGQSTGSNWMCFAQEIGWAAQIPSNQYGSTTQTKQQWF